MHNSRVQRLEICLLALLCIGSATPQIAGGAAFVAFNDFVTGLGSGSNITTYGPGQSGALKSISNGSNLGVSLSVTGSGQASGGVQGRPDYGSPASIVFDGIVDLAGFPDPALELSGAAVVTYTFSGLNPNSEYNFQGTAIRGNKAYGADRWSIFEIGGAVSFTSRHSSGAATTAQVPALTASQVAIGTGDNAQGVLAWWEHIKPSASGTFSITSQQYTGALPGGGTASGSKGYAITGFRLEEAPVYTGRTNLPPRVPGHSNGGVNGIRTVFVVMMENHDWSTIKGSANCPYINNTLMPQGAWCEKYYNPPSIHPSLPNYLWLISGTNFGIRDDANPSANRSASTQTLFHQMDAAGISWKCYAEDIPGNNIPDVNSGKYAVRHNPFMYFDTVRNNLTYCTNHIRPYTELAGDLASGNVARFNFLVPNVTNDMHDLTPGSASTRIQGDTWLSLKMPSILNSGAYTNGGLLIVTFDEGEGSTGDGPIGTILLSPRVKRPNYSSTNFYDHSSLVRSIQDIFGLRPYLGGAEFATDMAEHFKTMSISSITHDVAGTHVTATNLAVNRTAVLQFSADPVNPSWVNLKSAVSTSSSQTLTDTRPTPPASGIYRIREIQ